MVETAIVASGLAAAEGFSSVEKLVPEVSHEVTPETGNDFVGSGTSLNEEPQREHEIDVTTGPGTEDIHSDVLSSVGNDPTPVPQHLEPQIGLVGDQRDPSSSESALNVQKEIEASAKHNFTSTTEESAVVFTSQPETSYAVEGTPEHHSLLDESGKPDDESAVNQFETTELKATETDHMISPVEDKLDVVESKISDSAPILAATEQLPEVASEEIFQPQSTAVLVTEDVLDNKEDQIKDITSSTKLEGHGTVENIEAKGDYVVREVDLTCFS